MSLCFQDENDHIILCVPFWSAEARFLRTRCLEARGLEAEVSRGEVSWDGVSGRGVSGRTAFTAASTGVSTVKSVDCKNS